ncbi:MAG: GreA/GreB family elongation factor [Phycisphaerae bacterium]|nr:GreA/GreB family elongation factor [Phycisphaerae bacterium]
MKADLTAMIQLAASGNSKTVEELWMANLEKHGADAVEVACWAPLLKELADRDRVNEAETLAWAALETVQENAEAMETLRVAGPFLLALNQSDELKVQVAELYTIAYPDLTNLSVLLEEAGIAGGRPPRRALRTLDVCLNLQPGSYLVARYEHKAARVETIEAETWEVTVQTPKGKRTFGPVELADEYEVAGEDDFRVLRQFLPERFKKMLAAEPGQVVISILHAHGDKIDSDALADQLVPEAIPDGEWTKWWSKARAALRHNANVQIKGRAPYELFYHAVAIALESQTEARFKKLHDPLEQLACIEDYLRECKSAAKEPDSEMLARFKKRIDQAVRRQAKVGADGVLVHLLVSRRAALAMGVGEEEADQAVVKFLGSAGIPAELVGRLGSEALWPAACRCLKLAHPARYPEFCEALLPQAPAGVCDLLARDLMAGGFDGVQFDALVQRVLKEPVKNVNALAWLWLGPDAGLDVPVPPLPTLCAKLVGVAGEMKRRDDISREHKKVIQNRVRDALNANQYAQFKRCLEQTDAGVAATWQTQIVRLDNLGRAVPEDLIKLIRTTFPQEHRLPEVSPWKREDILYMTAAGRSKLVAEIDELVNVKMRENAKAIGEAASHGDLSENSEYKFALEERDLLRARVAQLQKQLAQAVVFKDWEVPQDQIGFGTRVTLRNTDDGQTCRMTFLGPREADIDRRIYNYKTPLGQRLMGLAPGDTVTLDFGEYCGAYLIEGIENSLQQTVPEGN